MSGSGVVITLFKEDLLKSCQDKDIKNVGIYDFRISYKEICHAEIVRYIDGSAIKILKDRYGKTQSL